MARLSAVTFVAGTSLLAKLGLPFGGHLVAALANGVPAVSRPFIVTGGTLALATLLWLGIALARRPDTNPAYAFELAAIAFLAIGAIVGTGVWLGWSGPLGIASARETHIHANVWGFATMIFASWLVRYGTIAAVSDAVARSLRTVFSRLAVGGSLLVAGPWIGANPVMAAGLVADAAGTLRLHATTRPALREVAAVGGDVPCGARHIRGAYAWLGAPLVGAPFVVLSAGSSLARAVESEAPQAVIFGWLLPLAIAWGPWIANPIVGRANARLGGTRLSLWAAHVGVLAWWDAIFAPAPVDGALRGLALALLAIAAGAATLRAWRNAAATGRSDVDTHVV
ncbi:MAG: hypothetical protein FJX78_07670 [Armatimonadetes bacterium]|nr:hypothetical protein [Armatimonadota bacterium]